MDIQKNRKGSHSTGDLDEVSLHHRITCTLSLSPFLSFPSLLPVNPSTWRWTWRDDRDGFLDGKLDVALCSKAFKQFSHWEQRFKLTWSILMSSPWGHDAAFSLFSRYFQTCSCTSLPRLLWSAWSSNGPHPSSCLSCHYLPNMTNDILLVVYGDNRYTREWMRLSIPRRRNNGTSWVQRRGADGRYTNRAGLISLGGKWEYISGWHRRGEKRKNRKGKVKKKTEWSIQIKEISLYNVPYL